MKQYFRFSKDSNNQDIIETKLTGKPLLSIPQVNKDTAFSKEERQALELNGKLPPHVESLDDQVKRAYFQFSNQDTRLNKYIYLNSLHDKNQVIFYKLLQQHIDEMIPIIYTPTVGTAVKTFNQKFRRARGLYISYIHGEQKQIEEILNNRTNSEIDLIVATDGEGVLGIGDQGISAMEIPIAKLAVYSALGGINPNRTLPIMLDVGSNNNELINNPMYLGWKHSRIRGKDYDQFINHFVNAVQNVFPNAFLHWEDLGRSNAARILNRYKDQLCTFNDDMQGTGVVALSAVMAAIKHLEQSLTEQKIIIFGGGTAGLGIAQRLRHSLQSQGLSDQQARHRLLIIDKPGLLIDSMTDLTDEQKLYARPEQESSDWQSFDLLNVINQINPTILIGCSGVSGAFSQAVIKAMAQSTPRPIIMPLSNPNKLAEATPQQIIDWTNNQALIATGSPFLQCHYQNKAITVSQCNNALIFPSIGLAVNAIGAKRLTDNMLAAAADALAIQAVTYSDKDQQQLLPNITDSAKFVKKIALSICQQAINDQVCDASIRQESDQQIDLQIIQQRIDDICWQPRYLPIHYCDF